MRVRCKVCGTLAEVKYTTPRGGVVRCTNCGHDALWRWSGVVCGSFWNVSRGGWGGFTIKYDNQGRYRAFTIERDW